MWIRNRMINDVIKISFIFDFILLKMLEQIHNLFITSTNKNNNTYLIILNISNYNVSINQLKMPVSV